MTALRSRIVVTTLACLALSSCGGGSSNPSDDGGMDPRVDAHVAVDAAPESHDAYRSTTDAWFPSDPDGLRIVFPPPSAAITSTIVVRGTWGTQTPSAVTVSGVAATSDDGFHTWRAEVPLEMGANDLVAEGGGQQYVVSVERFADEESVHRGTGDWSHYMGGMAYDRATHRVYIADAYIDGALAVDIATGERITVSASDLDPTIGTGYDLSAPNRIAIGDGYLVVNDGDLVCDIDLASGNRTLIAEVPDIGSGPGPGGAMGIGIHDGRTIFWSYDLAAMIEIERPSLTRTVLVDATHGSGPMLTSAHALYFDWPHQRVLALRQYQDSMWIIDLTTGNRTEVPDGSTSTTHFSRPDDLTWIDGVGAFVWADDRMVHVDVTTGAREELTTSGFSLRGLSGLSATDELLLAAAEVQDWAPPPIRDAMMFAIDPIVGTVVALAR